MLDLQNRDDLSSFWRVWRVSEKMMRPFRQGRNTLIKQYLGDKYGDAKQQQKVVIANQMALAADSYMMSLAGSRPRCSITTQFPDLTAFAANYEASTNRLIEEIRLERTLQRWVLDGFFGVGVVKVGRVPSRKYLTVMNPDFPPEPGMGSPPEVWLAYRMAQQTIPQTLQVDPGKISAWCVSLDDFVIDMTAANEEEVRFATHQYRVPVSELRQDSRFSPEWVEQLVPDSKWSDRKYENQERADESGKSETDVDDIESMVTLLDVWLPREQKWAVLSRNQEELAPGFFEDWTGPEEGPFHYLCFIDVPDAVWGMGPGQHLANLDELSNKLWRKLAFDAINNKIVLAYQGDPADAKAVKEAKHRDIIKVSSVDMLKEVGFGQVDQGLMAIQQIVEGAFSRQAGNLDAKTGLGPQSNTATQDSLIHGAVTAVEAKMVERVVSATAGVIRSLCCLLWDDKTKSVQATRQIPGVSLPVDASWSPGDRQGSFDKFNYNVEPYSMRYQSPGERANNLIGLLKEVIGPMMPAIMQAGGSLDFREVLDTLANYKDEPKLRQWIKFGGIPTAPATHGGDGGDPGMGGSTTRNYVRQSVSGANSPAGQRTQRVQSLLSGAGGQQGGA
jgi:hypothetical protein